MARIAQEIPKVGLVMENARLVRWLKSVGDLVTQGEPLLELETEKSLVEIEATASGRLIDKLVDVGEDVRVGDRVAWLDSDAEEVTFEVPMLVFAEAQPELASGTSLEEIELHPEHLQAQHRGGEIEAMPEHFPSRDAGNDIGEQPGPLADSHAAHEIEVQPEDLSNRNGSADLEARSDALSSRRVSDEGEIQPEALSGPGPSGDGAGAQPDALSRRRANTHSEDGPNSGSPPAASRAPADAGTRLRSSPVARRLAAENGVDLSTVPGSGPRGRVQLRDIQRAIEARSSEQRSGAAPSAPQELSSMRRALARTMTLSNATVPQFIVARAVDWTTLHRVRSDLNARLPAGTARPSVNDFLLQAIARALLTFPAVNATFSGEPDSADARIVPARGAHIGLVVAVENGLLVPVIHDANQLGLAELARRRSEAVDRALKGRLKREELEGATFSLSNLGARGPDRFTAIINPPQSAILAVGRQRDCVVARDGGIHIRPMSDLSLTVDHRVIDGRLASDFLAFLVEILEGIEWRT